MLQVAWYIINVINGPFEDEVGTVAYQNVNGRCARNVWTFANKNSKIVCVIEIRKSNKIATFEIHLSIHFVFEGAP